MRCLFGHAIPQVPYIHREKSVDSGLECVIVGVDVGSGENIKI